MQIINSQTDFKIKNIQAQSARTKPVSAGEPSIYIPPTNSGARHDISTKQCVIAMRREGKTYSEIRAIFPIAKSTLSEWLREVGLSTPQKQRITKLREEAQQKGARIRHEMAVEKRDGIYGVSREEIGGLSDREVWLLATMAYWAEGGKERANPGSQIRFGNMDPRMIRLFLYWLLRIQKIPFSDLKFEIYLHDNNKHRVDIVKKYWSQELIVPINLLSVVRFKKHKVQTKRKNIGDLYYGLIQVKVVASSTLVRQLEGWAQGIDCVIKSKITTVS
ncbi:MAG: hypothetical protein QG570_739 [Patescibacteria group bacterium]|nr:hypothetical protein [Patescibacteria group bacterium]